MAPGCWGGTAEGLRRGPGAEQCPGAGTPHSRSRRSRRGRRGAHSAHAPNGSAEGRGYSPDARGGSYHCAPWGWARKEPSSRIRLSRISAGFFPDLRAQVKEASTEKQQRAHVRSACILSSFFFPYPPSVYGELGASR